MRRNTAALLVIIAALLAVDIALRVSPREAVAQDQFEFEFEAARTPHVIHVETSGTGLGRVFRLWSDGVIEVAVFGGINSTNCLPADGIGWQEIAETVPLPPGVRITRIYTWQSWPDILVRLRSDGVVEKNYRPVGALGWCGWRTPPE